MLKVEMSQMHKWVVNSDNIKYFDSIHKTNGNVLTLDKRPYIDLLCEFNIFFTGELSK